MHPGDVFAINDPYLGGTHFNDVRIVRPIFHDGELIASPSPTATGPTSAAACPGSFDITAQGALRRGVCGSRRCASGRQRRVPPRRRAHDRLQHARARRRRGRLPRPGRGDRRGRARDPAPRRQVRPRHRRDRVGRGAGLRRAPDAPRLAELPDGTWETRGLHRLRPRRGRGAVPIRVKHDDRRRRGPLRPLRLASRRRIVPELRASARRSPASSRGRRRSSPTFPELGLLPRAGGRPRRRRAAA